MKSNLTKVLPVDSNGMKLSKKQSNVKGVSKTTRGSRSRLLEIEQAQKQELLKKIKEKDDRIAELLAKKEREKLLRKQQREADDLFHKSVLDKIKEEDERKRQETLQKILSKGRRADELIRERELLALAGRLNAVEVRERLERIWRKTSRGIRSFNDKSDNAFRKKTRRRMRPRDKSEEGESLETLSFEDLYMLMKAKSLDMSDMTTAINDLMDDVESTLRRTASDGELEMYGRNKDKYDVLESELDEQEDLMDVIEGRDENNAFRGFKTKKGRDLSESEMIDTDGNHTEMKETKDMNDESVHVSTFDDGANQIDTEKARDATIESVHQLSVCDEGGILTGIEEGRFIDNGTEANLAGTIEARNINTRYVHHASYLSSIEESRDIYDDSDYLSTCAVDLDGNIPCMRDSKESRNIAPSNKEECDSLKSKNLTVEEDDEEEEYVLNLNEATDIDTVFSSLSADLEKDMEILEEIAENQNIDFNTARETVYSWKMKTAFIMLAFSYILNSGSEEEPSIMSIASLYYDTL